MFSDQKYREFTYPLLEPPEGNPFLIPDIEIIEVEKQGVNLFHVLDVPYPIQMTIYPLVLLSMTNLYEAGKFISQAKNDLFNPQNLMNQMLELLDGPIWVNQCQYLTDNFKSNPILSPDLRIGALSGYILEMYHIQSGQCQSNPQ